MWYRQFKSAQSNVEQPSLFFEPWANNNEVKDENGQSQVLYHGTTHDFDQFQKNPWENADGWFGGGYYFTSSPEDASRNYAGLGPDMANKISHVSDDILQRMRDDYDGEFEDADIWDENGDFDDQKAQAVAEQMAKDQLMGGKDHVKPVYLRMNKPLHLMFNDPSADHFQFDEPEIGPDGEPDYDAEPIGNAADLRDAIYETAADYPGADPDKIWGDLYGTLDFHSGVHAYDLFRTLKDDEHISFLENYDTGTLVGQNFIRDIFKHMGYDGVVMDPYKEFIKGRPANQNRMLGRPEMEGVYPDTRHYIVWDGNQAKSAIGNNGLYSPTDNRITR